MTRDECAKLDKALDIYIGRLIYRLKNDAFDCVDYKAIDNFLREKDFKFGKWALDNLYDFAYINKDKQSGDIILPQLVELKITLVESFHAYYDFVLANNQLIKIDPDDLVLKISAHDTLVSFIQRYRSLWDKIMGVILLLYGSESQKKDFNKANSKKKTFKRLFKDNEAIWGKIGNYIDALWEFDDDYRTPEIHDAGRARNRTIFATDKLLEDDYHKELLDNYFNNLTDIANVFWQLLNYAKTEDKHYLDNIIQP